MDEAKELEPLTQSLMDEFTTAILPGCLQLLDTLPDTVYRVCDLLIAVAMRNGEKWIHDTLRALIAEIATNVNALTAFTAPMTSSDKRSIAEWASQVSSVPEASKAATRIHIFTLLFEEKRNECASFIQETDLMLNLVHLLEATQNMLAVVANNSPNTTLPTPKWLAPVVLLVDLFDKAAIASHRRAPLLSLNRRQWKWFDDRSGKWTTYTSSNNKTIDDAYKNGDTFVRFLAGRRKYTVQFSTMVQINEETGNWRPIMFVNDDKAMDVTEDSGPSKQSVNYKVVPGLTSANCSALIRACVGFISIPVEPDTLHAVMRLCLRLTRDYEQAQLFANLGGVKAILKLTQVSAFTGFNSLATLIVRHVLEEPQTLRQTMEKVIRSTTHHSPLSSCKEMHYILRVLGPAACRDSKLFSEVAKSILRISLVPLTKREEEDTRLQNPNAVQMLKLLPNKQTNPTSTLPSAVVRTVINDLLLSLTVKSAATRTDETTESKATQTTPNEDSSARTLSSANVLQRGLDMEDEDSELDGASMGSKAAAEKAAVASKEDENKKHRLLMSHSSILRLLAELARSYTCVAKLITDFTYQPGQSELITEECSSLSFIFDHLLPSSQTIGDKDAPALTRVFVASLASCNHCPDAQNMLVAEVKSALARALAVPESTEKHTKIQAITGIMNTMIESCPGVSPASNMSNSTRGQHPSNHLNNIVKIMLRKNIVNDLARVTHSLDLSSPHMAHTVNAALKPLETLSRIVNLPSVNLSTPSTKKPKTNQETVTHHEAMEEDNAITTSVALSDLVTTLVGAEIESRSMAGQQESITGLNTETTSTSDTNAFGDVTVDDNTDNDGVVIEDGVPFDMFSDRNPVGESLLDDELRHDRMADDSQNIAESRANETHENVINSNGAESESGEDSDSEDDEDEDNTSAADDDEDRDEDEEDDGEDDQDGEDDEAGSGFVDHDDDIYDTVMRYADARDDPFVFDIEDMIPSMFQDGSLRLSSLLPMLDGEQQSGANESQPSVPPAPGNVSIAHPLLVRHSHGDLGSSMGVQGGATAASSILATRTHRSRGGQRLYRPATSAGLGHSWHLPISGRHPTQVFLSTLHRTVSHLSFCSPQSGVNSTTPTRVIFASNDFQIIAADDDLFELQDTSLVNGGSSSSTLSSIPSAMIRW